MGGEWVSDYRLAREFESTTAVIAICQSRRIEGAEMVLQMGDKPSDAYDICLPLLVGQVPFAGHGKVGAQAGSDSPRA